MEPASSSSSSDGEESSQSSTSSSPSIVETNLNSTHLKSIDDLPTDDSGSELDSSSDESDCDINSDEEEDENHRDNNRNKRNMSFRIKSYSSESDEDSEDQTLEDRLKSRQQNGIHKQPPHKKLKASSEKRKKNQHAPKEISSKRSDYFRRGAPLLANSGISAEASIGINRYKARDPRMESLNGHFDQGAFDHNYAFLEEMQQNEIKKLKERIAARKLHGKKGQKKRKKLNITHDASTQEVDENELKRLLQLRSDKKRSKLKKEAKNALKQKMKEEIQSGKRKKEYYYKKKDIKRMELEAQYDLMKKKGGEAAINKLLAKKRKKNLGRDSKFMPPKNS